MEEGIPGTRQSFVSYERQLIEKLTFLKAKTKTEPRVLLFELITLRN